MITEKMVVMFFLFFPYEIMKNNRTFPEVITIDEMIPIRASGSSLCAHLRGALHRSEDHLVVT
jgi:hypothetical protein